MCLNLLCAYIHKDYNSFIKNILKFKITCSHVFKTTATPCTLLLLLPVWS